MPKMKGRGALFSVPFFWGGAGGGGRYFGGPGIWLSCQVGIMLFPEGPSAQILDHQGPIGPIRGYWGSRLL